MPKRSHQRVIEVLFLKALIVHIDRNVEPRRVQGNEAVRAERLGSAGRRGVGCQVHVHGRGVGHLQRHRSHVSRPENVRLARSETRLRRDIAQVTVRAGQRVRADLAGREHAAGGEKRLEEISPVERGRGPDIQSRRLPAQIRGLCWRVTGTRQNHDIGNVLEGGTIRRGIEFDSIEARGQVLMARCQRIGAGLVPKIPKGSGGRIHRHELDSGSGESHERPGGNSWRTRGFCVQAQIKRGIRCARRKSSALVFT